MRKTTPIFALLLLTLPSISFAAALTPQQSISLIAVVQSSPGTSASVFVPLITAFSNITVNQATSLITVVQAAPGTPASAFVNLLISFTVDTATTQPATNQAVTPTTSQSTTPAEQPVASTQPTNSVTLTFSPATDPYDGFNLTWESKNSTSCTLDSSPNLLASSGSVKTGVVSKTKTYVITCVNFNSNSSASSSVTIQPYPTCKATSDGYPNDGILIDGKCIVLN